MAEEGWHGRAKEMERCVNLILFEEAEIGRPLPAEDERAKHILEVLRRQKGDDFDVGLIDGPRGKGLLKEVTETGLVLEFRWGEEEPPLDPLVLIVGLSRPQTNRKILREATAVGVQRMLFALTERGEPNYVSSRLWTTGEYKRHVLAGVEQAFSTRVPQVEYGMSLEEALSEVGELDVRYALDNYEQTVSMGQVRPKSRGGIALAVGSERGWTGRERDLLRDSGFLLAGMGERVLRTETAVIAALALAKAAIGSW
jgi:16S rRNA (uracil1498-N3)-methyltransferase